MRGFVVLAVFLLAAYVCAEDKAAEKTEDKPKTYKRLIPADVLRGKFYARCSGTFARRLTIFLPCNEVNGRLSM